MPVTLITVSSGCFLSVETFCVIGRAHATARHRLSLTFPGNDEPRVGAFARDSAPTSSIGGWALAGQRIGWPHLFAQFC